MPSKSLGIGLKFKADTQPVNYALRHLQASVSGANAGILQQSRAMEKNSKYMTKAMAGAFNQGAYAVEDFLTVFATTGFGGGMRAAANNISMVARALGGPFVGGIIGATVAGISMIPTLKSMKEETKELTKEVNEQANAYNRLIDVRTKLSKENYQFHKDRNKAEYKQDIDSQIDSVRSRNSELARDFDAINKKMERVRSNYEQWDRAIGMTKSMGLEVNPQDEEQIKKWKKEYKELQAERRANLNEQKLQQRFLNTLESQRKRLPDKEEEDKLKKQKKELESLLKSLESDMSTGFEKKIDAIFMKFRDRLKKIRELAKGDQARDLFRKAGKAAIIQFKGLEDAIKPKDRKVKAGQLAPNLKKGTVEATSAVNKMLQQARFGDQNKAKYDQEQLAQLKVINSSIKGLEAVMRMAGINGVQVGP